MIIRSYQIRLPRPWQTPSMQELEKARAELDDLRKQQNASAAASQAERGAFHQVDTWSLFECGFWMLSMKSDPNKFNKTDVCILMPSIQCNPVSCVGFQEKLMKEKKSLREQLEKMQDQMQRMVSRWCLSAFLCHSVRCEAGCEICQAARCHECLERSNFGFHWGCIFLFWPRNLCNSSWKNACMPPKGNGMPWSNGCRLRVGSLTGQGQFLMVFVTIGYNFKLA